MAEDNKGYYCSKVKFYFLDITSDGEVNTSHLPIVATGTSQSLDSLYPSNTNAHYYDDIEVYLKETDLADKYETDKSYIDTTRPGKFCFKAFSSNQLNKFYTPIAGKYFDLDPNSQQAYSAAGFVLPTKHTVDDNFKNLILSYNLLYRQDFGTSSTSIWKDIDASKITNKFGYVKYQMPFDLGVSLRSMKPIGPFEINEKWFGIAGTRSGLYTEEQLNTWTKPENSDSRFKYVPKVEFALRTITYTANRWRLAPNYLINTYPVARITMPQNTNTAKYGDNALTLKLVPPSKNYYDNDVVIDTKDNFAGWADFSLLNMNNSKVPAYSTISLTGEKIKYLEFKDAYKPWGDAWDRFKIYNPNPFPVYCYVCNRRLKSIEIDKWVLDYKDEKENGFRYFGQIGPQETTDEIRIGDWSWYNDNGVGVYFMVNYGDYCKIYATTMDNADSIDFATAYKYKYFKF